MQILGCKFDMGNHTKGDIIEIRASGSPFSGKEPEKFFLVEVPEVPMDDFLDYTKSWERLLDFEVVAQDLSIDGFRLKLFSALTNGAAGIITKAEVEAFIQSWNGAVFSWGANEVVFDIAIYNALISPAFWEFDVSGVVFSELSYVQATGVHTIQMDYSAIDKNPTYAESYVRSKGLTITYHDQKILRYEATRTIARSIFQDDLKEKSRKAVTRRRYYLASAVVDYIVGQGGTITTDKATLLNYINDKVA